MALYSVRQAANIDPPQWIIVIAIEAAPGRTVPFNSAGPFFSHADALAQADKLNREQVSR